MPRSVYSLKTDELTQITGGDTGVESLVLGLGDAVELPDGLGSVEFTSLPRFVSLEVHHDPTQVGVLISVVLAFLGLLTSLFVPRRRLWIAAETTGDGVRLQYAGLARGDDPRLERAVAELADSHEATLRDASSERTVASTQLSASRS